MFFISIQKINAYIAAVEAGSITSAAKQLNYTQSAVSRMVSDLESEWNVSLLIRNRSGVEISAEGATLLPILKMICKDYDNLNYAISELHGVQAGLIRIGSFSSMSTGWLPKMIKAFNLEYPNIDFELINGEYSDIISWIRKGKVDCGFIKLPTSQDLDARFLFKDELVAVLPKNHPLSSNPYFPKEALKTEKYIGLKEEQDYDISQFLDSLDENIDVRYAVSNDYAVLTMVECGLGISVVHDLILRPNRYDIVKKPFSPQQFRDIGIATRKGFTPSTVTALFLQHAQMWSKDKTNFG